MLSVVVSCYSLSSVVPAQGRLSEALEKSTQETTGPHVGDGSEGSHVGKSQRLVWSA